jgi:oxaloacetate decarboxylase alpha subunit
VRRELGYPIIVSPFAQFVVTQAVLNVVQGERYATVPDEVRKYTLGYYGELAAPIDPNVLDRIAGKGRPVTARPGDLLAPALERVRRERGPFASDDDLLLATFYSPEQYAKLVAARPIETDYPIGRTPLVTLVRELAARRDIVAVRLERKRTGRRHGATA